MAIVKWNTAGVAGASETAALGRLLKCGHVLERYIKRSFGAGGPSGTRRGATQAERHANRSKPGEPPHVDTGRLRASITVNWRGSKKTRRLPESGERARIVHPVATSKENDGVSKPEKELRVRVGTNVEYAQHLEFGTRRMDARPYIRPAFDAMMSQMQRIMVTKSGEGEAEE